MSEEDSDFQQAVLEWQHKHGIRDDDPMLASLELLQLFFANAKIKIPDSDAANAIEVRAALQQLDRLGKDFSKQARELIQEVRSVPKLHDGLAAGRFTAIFLTAVSAFGAGILIGKFVL
ncbi:MAG: hypothetical protein L0Z50_21270 [Verrucomicrobiales bacterium]|nr:hypothetical protein [Verrucomicrobiales bacterium]